MAKRRYIQDFAATHKAPYLGMPPGLIQCRDVEDLPRDVEALWLTRKSSGVENLATFKQLRRIHAPLREDWLPVLASIPNLEYAKFTLPKSAEIPSLKCLSNLRSLVLSCNRHQTNLEFVRDMKWLHSLCVSEAMSVSLFAPLSTLSELRELYIDGTITGRQTIDSLSPLADLTHLQFAVLLIRIAKANRTLAPLHKLKQLKFLHLSDDYLPEEYDLLIKTLPRLTEICFNAGKRWPMTEATT